MKYCSHCGNEILDEAVICPKCGCSVVEAKQTTSGSNNTTLLTVAKVFMIIACALYGFMGLIYIIILGGAGLLFLLPLAWCIPMTISVNNKIKNGEPIGVGFKVCTLLFVSLISGILLLCHHDD